MHSFTTSAALTVTNNVQSFDVVVGAAGGYGGYSWHYGWTGGWGGSGQAVVAYATHLSPSTYLVTVGGTGCPGGSSSLAAFTAAGGGCGGAAGDGYHGASGSPAFQPILSSITGTLLSYGGVGGHPGAPNGGGGQPGGAGTVVVRYEIAP